MSLFVDYFIVLYSTKPTRFQEAVTPFTLLSSMMSWVWKKWYSCGRHQTGFEGTCEGRLQGTVAANFAECLSTKLVNMFL